MPNAPQPAKDAPEAPPDASLDLLMGGKVRVWQAKAGYRAGMDAALLAAALKLSEGKSAIEAGCGAGAALIQAAVRAPGARLLGVERDPAALALARLSLAENGIEDRVAVQAGEVAAGFAGLNEPPFDLAFCNPPFFDDPAGLRGPSPAKAGAWLADDGLATWTGFLLAAVGPGGQVVLIHRADRLGDILRLFEGGAGSIRIRPVQPFADTPAKRVLVQATKGGRAPLVLLPPLILHDRQHGRHTPEAEAILRGEAALGWS